MFLHSRANAGVRFLDVRGSPGNCTYLLPIRRDTFSAAEVKNFASYFQALEEAGCEVLVVDGSPAAIFDAHHGVWSGTCRHQSVDARFTYLNGKVNGVRTGLEIASCDEIIMADDDIRYRAEQLALICQRLERFDVVRPQNFIMPLPWWARIESARMLINRATLRSGDYPGTCAFRRSAVLRAGEYDGDVLFDNEEMIRHFVCRGLSIDYEIDLLVEKTAPSFRKWIEQRPRQAYEDFALRGKTVFFASILPLAAFLTLLGKFQLLIFFGTMLAIGPIMIAAAGWGRGKAAGAFPISTCWFAPLWIFERASNTYIAFWWRVFRGGYPFGDRILSRGVGRDWFSIRKNASLPLQRSTYL
jgi:hypothetical protein